MTQRTGTSFLLNLVTLHPACGAGGVIWEDYLVAHSDLLVRYVSSVFRQWNKDWKVPDVLGGEEVLCRRLGDALLSYLQSQAEHGAPKRFITKTPSVANLRHFFKLFPDAYLLIIVRDGRDVVESGAKSFGWNSEDAARRWAEAARAVIEFERDNQQHANRFVVIRYEELFNDTEAQLRRIFATVGLDPAVYDFAAAAKLPVKGSSALGREEGAKVHWKPVEKTRDFDPTKRSSGWGRGRRERFNWIAGARLAQLGYPPKVEPSNRAWWGLWNRALDFRRDAGTQWERAGRLLGRIRRGSSAAG